MATEKVCIIGSGNWGSAIARIVGGNVLKNPRFDNAVNMWVYEEMVGEPPRKLTEIINQDHVNAKYLPGVTLPVSIVANPDLVDTVKGATILIFVLPHQFLPRLLPQIKGKLAPGAKAISLIKGIDFNDKGIVLISDLIRNALEIDVSVLMGANVANEVARDQFCETTIGYRVRANGEVLMELFDAPAFRVAIANDCVGVELCGALKNIVAIGAGYCDGLGFGGNTKAAIIRIGLQEMIRFCKKFYQGVKDSTFFESCGVADLITTCFGGRNRKCAEAYVKTGKDWDTIEKEILNGQKLQGTLTAKEVHEVLKRVDAVAEFPFFTNVYRIAYEGVAPDQITKVDYNNWPGASNL